MDENGQLRVEVERLSLELIKLKLEKYIATIKQNGVINIPIYESAALSEVELNLLFSKSNLSDDSI
jgi:hypothetical protein